MDFYFVGLDMKHFDVIKQRRMPLKPNLLVPMNRMTPKVNADLDDLKRRGLVGKLALDSGAFAIQKDKNADAEKARKLYLKFMEYAKANAHKFDIIFNFDRVFTPDGFLENYENLLGLLEEGIPAWPVSHDIVGKDYKDLIDMGYKKIAIGQDKGRNLKNLITADIEMIILGIEKVHLLGVATPKLLYHIPITSADASSAKRYAGFGRINFYNPDDATNFYGEYLKLPKRHTTEPTEDEFVTKKEILLKWLATQNIKISWEDLTCREWSTFATLVNIAFYIEAARRETEHHKEILRFLFTAYVE